MSPRQRDPKQVRWTPKPQYLTRTFCCPPAASCAGRRAAWWRHWRGRATPEPWRCRLRERARRWYPFLSVYFYINLPSTLISASLSDTFPPFRRAPLRARRCSRCSERNVRFDRHRWLISRARLGLSCRWRPKELHAASDNLGALTLAAIVLGLVLPGTKPPFDIRLAPFLEIFLANFCKPPESDYVVPFHSLLLLFLFVGLRLVGRYRETDHRLP